MNEKTDDKQLRRDQTEKWQTINIFAWLATMFFVFINFLPVVGVVVYPFIFGFAVFSQLKFRQAAKEADIEIVIYDHEMDPMGEWGDINLMGIFAVIAFNGLAWFIWASNLLGYLHILS